MFHVPWDFLGLEWFSLDLAAPFSPMLALSRKLGQMHLHPRAGKHKNHIYPGSPNAHLFLVAPVVAHFCLESTTKFVVVYQFTTVFDWVKAKMALYSNASCSKVLVSQALEVQGMVATCSNY